MKPYKLPIAPAEAAFTEKKSRFIGYISPVATEEEARAFLQKIREMHREASHNVYAYRLMENACTRHSDDGEPAGTAGMPLLNTFVKQDIYDFCCVATRYYGGIMLGAGGLVRAYTRCATLALKTAGIGTMRTLAECTITLPYALYEGQKRLLIAHNANIINEDFGAAVTLTLTIPDEMLSALQAETTEQTAGTVDIKKVGMRHAVSSI